jgi:hypothetical protein
MYIDLNMCNKKDQRTVQQCSKEGMSVVYQICFFKQENNQSQQTEKQIKNTVSDPEIKIREFHNSKIHLKNQWVGIVMDLLRKSKSLTQQLFIPDLFI